MAETPDFEQLAREISDNNGIGRLEEWDSETPDAVIAAIAEQLRLVWNARGAADIAKVDAVLYADGTSRTGFDKMLDGAIRSLDR